MRCYYKLFDGASETQRATSDQACTELKAQPKFIFLHGPCCFLSELYRADFHRVTRQFSPVGKVGPPAKALSDDQDDLYTPSFQNGPIQTHFQTDFQ